MSPVVSLLLASLLAAEPEPSGIFGGEVVDAGEWPAVVTVRTQKLCTGTLVAPNLVLTAAHCFDPAPAGNVLIDFGESYMDPDLTIAAEAWGAHPDFCLPSECEHGDLHDFAWVRLSVDLDVAPILPITDQDEYDAVMNPGQALVFVGFGEDEQMVSGIKREVTSKITSFNDSGREFRAGGDGKDTCQGDSGGPALVQLDDGTWRVAGVLSRGGECGEGGVYGVPLPELCWVRDASGVDLLPAGCDDCECVDITPARDEGCECGIDRRREVSGLPGLLALLGFAALGLMRVRAAARR